MTREEAIKFGKRVLSLSPFDEMREFCKIAVKALEEEPCEDCISRKAVIDRINKLIEVEKKQGTDDWGYGRERVNAYEAMLHMVENKYLYPSVEPERKPGKWIPVSERLPEVGSEVIVCFDFKGKRSVYISNFYGDGEFHGLDDEYLSSEGRKYRKAVAWMPQPEPYEEDEV